MVQQSVIEYVRRLLKQGYDVGAIRTALLNAGYSPYDVDKAIQLAGGSERRVSTKLLVIIFVVLLVLGLGVFFVLKLMQPAPVVLTFSLSLFSTEVSPGQDVIVNVDIQNPSGRETSGLIDFVVNGPGGQVASRTESFSLATRTSVPVSISLPSSAPPGSYVIKATLSYDDKSSSQPAIFEVVERAPDVTFPTSVLEERDEVEARELQQTCPGGCDDLSFCTKDECVQGSCINEPIVPCCGNTKCEPGETEDSCLLDCAERSIGPDEIREQAKEIAVSSVPGAIETCDSLAQRSYIDSCLSDVSGVSNSKEPCALIVDDDVRDSCYITFAYQNDFTVCPLLTNRYMKNSCISLAEITRVQPTA